MTCFPTESDTSARDGAREDENMNAHDIEPEKCRTCGQTLTDDDLDECWDGIEQECLCIPCLRVEIAILDGHDRASQHQMNAYFDRFSGE